MKTFALALVLLAGCGTATPEDKLQGTWFTSQLDAQGCGSGVSFVGDKIVLQDICFTSPTVGNDQAIKGTFSATDSLILAKFTDASCPSAQIATEANLPYAFSGGSLVITSPSAAIILERDTQAGGSGSLTFGCFASDGSFTPMPITAL